MESKYTLEKILTLNIIDTKNYSNVIIYFQELFLTLEVKECVARLIRYFNEKFQQHDTMLLSSLFCEIFALGTRIYHAKEKEEVIQIILPALTFFNLYQINPNMSILLGNLIQYDHENSLGFHVAQIIEWLLDNHVISLPKLSEIFKTILVNEYTSRFRIGRLINSLIVFMVLQFNEALFLIELLREELNLDQIELSDLVIGIKIKSLTRGQENSLYEYYFKSFPFTDKMGEDDDYSSYLKGLSSIISHDIVNRNSSINLINYCISIGYEHLIADSLKFLIDSLILSETTLINIFSDLLDNMCINYEQVSHLISKKFTKKEILRLLIKLIQAKYQVLTKQDFIHLFQGFLNNTKLGLSREDMKAIHGFLENYHSDIISPIHGIDFDTLVSESISFPIN